MGRTRSTHSIDGVEVALSFARRLVGLMGRRELGGSSLLIPRCASVHTCFMRGPVDVLFLNESNVVLAVHREVPAWRFLYGPRNATSTLELPAGRARRQGVQIGDVIECRFI